MLVRFIISSNELKLSKIIEFLFLDLNVEPKDELLAEAMSMVLLNARSNSQSSCRIAAWTGIVKTLFFRRKKMIIRKRFL